MKTNSISGNNTGKILTLYFATFILLVAMATIIYDDPRLGLVKRLLYAILSFSSVATLFLIIYASPANLLRKFPLIKWYFLFYILFVCLNLINTLRGDNINPVTLTNNPYALMSAVSPFAILLGIHFEQSTINSIIKKTTPIFVASYIWAYINPLASKIPYFMGYVSSFAFYPIMLTSPLRQKTIPFLLIVSTLWFSYISEFRILALRFFAFFGLLFFFILFKRATKIKIFGIIITLYLLITGLFYIEHILDTLNALFPSLNADYDDTRTFLYEEFSIDMSSHDYIFGRGFLGTYYSYYFQNLLSQGNYSDYFVRFTIEVGILELILKGGIPYLLFYWVPLLVSSIRGILSKDTALIAMSTFLFTESVLFWIENVPFYSYMSVIQFILCGIIIKNTKNENLNYNTNVQPS